MRGGGRHKDKSSKSEKKQATNPETPEQKCDEESKSDEGPAMMDIECVSEGIEVQQKVQSYLAGIQKWSWMNKEQFEHLEGGVWRVVEARRKGRGEEQEQWWQGEQGQNPGQEHSKQDEQVRFGEQEQLGKT